MTGLGGVEIENFNTIKARHVGFKDGKYSVHGREYCWHIPKALRHLNIQKGDFVVVRCRNKRKLVVVWDVFRENIEDTGKRYKPVVAKLNKRYDFNPID